ncbi:MAG: sigma-70 family RNA polymerase sigma factor [Planctomycetota bacterium]
MSTPDLPDLDLATISKLIVAAKVGDSDAHSEICRHVQPQLNRMADQQLDGNLRRKLNPSDIVQATLARMVQGFDDFRGSSSQEFYGWLNSILRNEVNSTRRDYGRDRRDIRREIDIDDGPSASDPANEDDPHDVVVRRETLETFHAVLSRLPTDYATVIQLRSIEELPFGQVAERMDRSVAAVSKLWARALVKLQQELAALQHDRQHERPSQSPLTDHDKPN